MLRRLGPLLTTEAPWEPRAEAINRRRVAAPYSADELELLWRDAQHQATPARLRAGQVLIALGAGAGLDGRWSTRVAAESVIRRDGIVCAYGSARRRLASCRSWPDGSGSFSSWPHRPRMSSWSGAGRSPSTGRETWPG